MDIFKDIWEIFIFNKNINIVLVFYNEMENVLDRNYQK